MPAAAYPSSVTPMGIEVTKNRDSAGESAQGVAIVPASAGEDRDVTDQEIEGALVRAVLSGRDALAETLRSTLQGRQRARAGNVIPISRQA